MNDILDSKTLFEKIKHIDKEGNEYWCARELMGALLYSNWQNFIKVIDSAKQACELSENNILDHFTDVSKMIDIAKGAKREVRDFKLSRYACYLIAQNSDSRKKVVAIAQTYFAIQTRKQELSEFANSKLTDEEQRIFHRNLIKKGNLSLNKSASKAGVRNFARFHNAGYMGLYNGETANDIAKRKGLQYRQDILDYMDNEELVDNLFRIVQTESRLKNDNIVDSQKASQAHYEIGKNIREVIIKNKGTLPENLPTPEKSIKELDNSKNKDSLII